MRLLPNPGSLPLAIALLHLAALPATGQPIADHQEAWASDAIGDVTFLGLNALTGGLTAGLWQELSGGSFEDGFAGGALGGAVVYAGKRVAAGSFPGAGFLGRDLAAVGSSVVRNAAEARPLLDSLMLPVGPVRLYAGLGDPRHPRVELDLRDAYWIVYGLAEERLAFDAGESLSSGAAVFRADRTLLSADERAVSGMAAGGVIFLSPRDDFRATGTLVHERAHVLQLDFMYHAWLRPLEDAFARRLPWRGFVDRVDYDLALPALRWGVAELGWGRLLDGPIEAEAEFLEGR